MNFGDLVYIIVQHKVPGEPEIASLPNFFFQTQGMSTGELFNKDFS